MRDKNSWHGAMSYVNDAPAIPRLEYMKKVTIALFVFTICATSCGQQDPQGSSDQGLAGSLSTVENRLLGSWTSPESTKYNDKISIALEPKSFSMEHQSAAEIQDKRGKTTYLTFCDIITSSSDFRVQNISDLNPAFQKHLVTSPGERYVIVASNATFTLVDNPDNSTGCQSVVDYDNGLAATGPLYITFGFDIKGRLMQSGSIFQKVQ
jgi:hypothetical protein